MGCGCGGARAGSNGVRAVVTHQVVYADSTTRNYLTRQEAEAAVRASQRTANPATYSPPVTAGV